MPATRTKLLLLGIDGAGFDLVSTWAARGALPHLRALMDGGLRGPLRSTFPPVTFPAWSSLLCGVDPSHHGLTDFTLRQGYSVRFVGGEVRAVPTVFDHLEGLGLTCGTAWFPTTYPPRPLRGYQISGWDSPVTAHGNKSFVHPRALHSQLKKTFGGSHLSFDTIDEFSGDPEWHLTALARLVERVEQKGAMAEWLLEHHPTDVAAFYFGETDTVAHHFWAFHDPNSPRRPEELGDHLTDAVEKVYRAVDAAVGRLLKPVGDDTSIILASDHGSGGSSDVCMHPNRMLQQAGLLHFEAGRTAAGISPSLIRNTLPRLVPSALRRHLFHLFGGLGPRIAESAVRFRGIDFSQTVAFSEELNYAPSIWFNQLGREPKGILRSRERLRTRALVERAAARLKSPEGHPLIANVTAREELYDGPFLNRIPDLLIETNPLSGYYPQTAPSRGTPGPAVTRIPREMSIGRKGQSLSGCHTPWGFYAARGPSITGCNAVREERIECIAGLACELLGLPPAPWIQESTGHAGSVGFDKPEAGLYNPRESAVVAERLRRLGYLE